MIIPDKRINKPPTPALSFQMPGKTFTLAVVVFVLTIALHSACFGATLPKLSVDLTRPNDDQFNERIAKSLEARVSAFTANKLIRFGNRYVVYPCGPFFMSHDRNCMCAHFYGPNFLRLRADNISIAFLNCTSINLLVMETSVRVPPKWAGVLMDDLVDDYLILNKTETSEGYAMRIMDRLLSEVNDPEFYFSFEASRGDSVAAEVKQCKDAHQFVPSFTLEIKGKNWLRVEINKEKLIGIIQDADSWGFFTLDQPTADALVKFALEICALENASSSASAE